jgi:diguanylate cyclase (GGDEF)-like protein/PAS domain S-box-containing protein
MARTTRTDTLEDTEARYRDLFRHTDHAVLIADKERILALNDAAIGLFGASQAAQLIGLRLSDFLTLPPVEEATGSTEAAPAPSGTGPGRPEIQGEAKLKRLDRAVLSVRAIVLPCRYEGRAARQILLRDATERSRLEGRLQFLVRHDLLTQLPNRTEFRDRLVGAMARARRNARQVAVMLLNVDKFKAVNARHGIETGDLVLAEVARRLTGGVRQADSVARIAGDEFGLILEAIDQREQAAVVANRVLPALKAPIQAGGTTIEITASAGIAAFPSDAQDIDPLLRMADVAMYAAKDGGPGGFRFYFPELEAMSHRDQLRRQQTLERIERLTAREREVLDVLIEGNSNKAIGYLLGASTRTIETHRAKIMEKMEAGSLPDLVRMVLESRSGK